MTAEVIFLTPEGKDKLTEEFKYLVGVRRAEVAEMISDAKEAGDVRENSAYDEAKEQQAFVEGRIRQVEDILARSQLIEENGVTDEVVIGCEVTVAEDGEDPEHFRIVGSAEADPTQGTISNESPLGSALLGKRKGDSATITTPSGEQLTFTIVSLG